MRYLILFLSLAFVQCKKDNFSYYSGRATANLNGVVWSAKVHIGKNSPNDTLFDILIDRFNTRGEVSEDLFIFEIALKLGRQKIYQGDTHDSIYAPGCSYVTVVVATLIVMYTMFQLPTPYIIILHSPRLSRCPGLLRGNSI